MTKQHVQKEQHVTQELIASIKRLVPHLGSKNQVEITPEYVQQIVATDANTLLTVYDSQQRILGMAVLIISPTLVNPRAFLETLVVDPDARHHGIASALIDESLRIAAEHDVKTLRASTHVSNEAGNSLLASMGGVVEDDYLWYEFAVTRK